LNKKRAERINEWFDKNKGELFIEIDPDYKSCDLLHGK
jgi:peptidyl-prolyl cis-trans isomerase SurA